jgi:hypothetical protein
MISVENLALPDSSVVMMCSVLRTVLQFMSARMVLIWLVVVAVFVPSSVVEAAPESRTTNGNQHSRMKNPAKAKTRFKALSRAESKAAKAKAMAEARAKAEAEAVSGRKVAVFSFEGDDTEPMRMQVVRLFKSKRMQVLTSLRPVDSPEQYRDMAFALNLAVYVHGKVKLRSRDQGVLTIMVRNGYSGRRLATARITGHRQTLTDNLEESLWGKVSASFARACIDASKPNRPHNPPMRIEAGTPL